MATYIVKIELNFATEEDYDLLHSFMKNLGFEKTITSMNNLTYRLAPNEYYYVTEFDSAQVFELASTAANRTNKSFEVLVIKAEEVMWGELFNLAF